MKYICNKLIFETPDARGLTVMISIILPSVMNKKLGRLNLGMETGLVKKKSEGAPVEYLDENGLPMLKVTIWEAVHNEAVTRTSG